MNVYVVTRSHYECYEGGDTCILEVCGSFEKAFGVVKCEFPSAVRRKTDGKWIWYIPKNVYEDIYLNIECFDVK